MYTKTTSNDRLDKKRGLFFSIGLLISTLLVVVAFEWKTEVKPVVIPDPPEADGIYIMDPVPTRHDIPERPKPKVNVAEKQKPVEIIEIKKELEKITVALPPIEYDEGDPVPEIELKKEEAPVYFAGTVAVNPSFEGGLEAFYRYISKNIHYVNKDIEGTMVLGFIINKKGEITEIEIIKGLDEALEKEAIRVLESCPLWSPGSQAGEPVRVRMQIPIKFGLKY